MPLAAAAIPMELMRLPLLPLLLPLPEMPAPPANDVRPWWRSPDSDDMELSRLVLGAAVPPMVIEDALRPTLPWRLAAFKAERALSTSMMESSESDCDMLWMCTLLKRLPLLLLMAGGLFSSTGVTEDDVAAGRRRGLLIIRWEPSGGGEKFVLRPAVIVRNGVGRSSESEEARFNEKVGALGDVSFLGFVDRREDFDKKPAWKRLLELDLPLIDRMLDSGISSDALMSEILLPSASSR